MAKLRMAVQRQATILGGMAGRELIAQLATQYGASELVVYAMFLAALSVPQEDFNA